MAQLEPAVSGAALTCCHTVKKLTVLWLRTDGYLIPVKLRREHGFDFKAGDTLISFFPWMTRELRNDWISFMVVGQSYTYH